MAAMPIYGKTPFEIFFGISGQISTKRGIKHRGLPFIIVYSDDDLGLTLTYFTAKSIFDMKAFL